MHSQRGFERTARPRSNVVPSVLIGWLALAAGRGPITDRDCVYQYTERTAQRKGHNI